MSNFWPLILWGVNPEHRDGVQLCGGSGAVGGATHGVDGGVILAHIRS